MGPYAAGKAAVQILANTAAQELGNIIRHHHLLYIGRTRKGMYLWD
jgi:hypothetical protein